MQKGNLNRQSTSSTAKVHIVKDQEELKDFIINEVEEATIKFLNRKKLAV